jgi:GNAT superfamily N-acetyltransferase
MANNNFQIRVVVTEGDLEQVRDLFREYFIWVDTIMHFDMTYQGVEQELQTLPGAYSPPEGCLLLAQVDGQAAGCVALRPREQGVCELKRMYVRPEYQGQGLGRALCERVIQEGKEKGYSLMRLDTEKTLRAAQHIYHSFGFKDVPPYYAAPPGISERAVFMELALL